MTKIDGRVRDLGGIPSDLLDALVCPARDAERLWVSSDPRFVMTHEDSQHIILRFPDRYPASHCPASYTERWADWQPLVEPIINLVRTRYGFTDVGLAKIVLSRLNAHACIPPHVDSHPSSQVPHKVHVPLITDPAVHFVIDGTRHHLAFGRAYEINNLLTHSVKNESNRARVHLIFEIYPNAAA
jgi:Aspartyl/Asparaginyl beta-hydroxylase